MPRPGFTRRLRRSLLAGSFALPLGACTTWMEAPNPSPPATNVVPGPLRITRRDGFSIVMEHVSVRNDSVVGHEQGHDDRLVAVALADVRKTERQDVDLLGSLGGAALGVAAGFGAYVLYAITHSD
jgi:hypothetical protein